MGFSVPPRLRLERWALTPPFHPYPRLLRSPGGLSFCGTVRRDASRRHLPRISNRRQPCGGPGQLRGIAPFGVRTFLLPRIAPGKAILRPSKITGTIPPSDESDKAYRSPTPSRPGSCPACSRGCGRSCCTRRVPFPPGTAPATGVARACGIRRRRHAEFPPPRSRLCFA